MSNEKRISEEEKIPEEKERLSMEELQGMVERWVKEEGEREPQRKGRVGSFIESRFSQIKEAIKAEGGMLGFIAEKVFPLLYFPAWKEMWKMREEQRRREILYASVGKCRNLLEAAVRGITAGIAGEEMDYNRRYQMFAVKKEVEEMAGEEESYVRFELRRALKAKKLDRAEACVRILHPDANFNEIFRDKELAEFGYTDEEKKKMGSYWGTYSGYFWLVKQFGRKRAQYVSLDLAKDFSKGFKNMDQVVHCDPRTGKLTERKPFERAMAAAIHSTKMGTRMEYRNLWTFSFTDEDLNPEVRPELYQEMEGYFEQRVKELPKKIKKWKTEKEKKEAGIRELAEELEILKGKDKPTHADRSKMYDLERKIIPEERKETRIIEGKIYEAKDELSDLKEKHDEEKLKELEEKEKLTEDEKKEKENLEIKTKERKEDEEKYQKLKEKVDKGEELSPDEKPKYEILRVRLKKIKAVANPWELARKCLVGGADILRPIDEDLAGDAAEMYEALRRQIEAFVFGGVKAKEYYYDFEEGKIKLDEKGFEDLLREMYRLEFKKELTDTEIEEKKNTIRQFLRGIHLRKRGFGRSDWDLETGLPKTKEAKEKKEKEKKKK